MKKVAALFIGAILSLGLFAGTPSDYREDGIPASNAPATPTKGSLWIGDGTNWMKIDAGANGKILTADSSLTLGLKWADPTPAVDATANYTWTGTHTFDLAQIWKAVATPANPAAGYFKTYIKSNGKIYVLNSAGVETELGAGAGTVTSIDTGNGLSGGSITTSGTIDLRLDANGTLSKTLGVGSNELGVATGGITNTQVAAGAGIGWTKISKTGSTLADLDTRSASDLSSGTLPDARFPATLPAVSGANLTALNASNVSSGILGLDHGGTGQITKLAAFDALSPLTTQGDLIYFDGINNVRLGKGTSGQVLTMNATVPVWADVAATGAPTNATYITSTSNGTLSNEFALGSLATGILKNTTTTGIPTIAVSGTDYELPLTFTGGVTRTGNSISVDTTQNITRLSNLTTNGFVKSGSGNGTLSVDTNTYLTTAVTSVATGNGLSGGTITGTGTVDLRLDANGTLSKTLGAGSNELGIASGGILNAHINTSAAIDWSKISKTGSSLADLTTRSASDLSSGTLPDARFPATLPAVSGANLTNLNGTSIASGTVGVARGGSGANLSATGGASQVVKQVSVGAAFTVGQLAASDLSNGTTGSGSVVLATSPTLVTPTLGAALATSLNGLTVTSSTGTLTIANSKTLTASNTLTFTGADASSVAFGGGGTVAYTLNNLSVFASTTSAQLAGVLSDETGTGAFVLANTPTLVTPEIGNATAAGITGSDSSLGIVGKTGASTSGGDVVVSGGTGGSSAAGGVVYIDGGGPGAGGFGEGNIVIGGTRGSFVDIGKAGGSIRFPGLTTGPLKLNLTTVETGAINLASAEVTGVLPNANGGAPTTSAQLASGLSDETGSGAAVFATSPTLVTPTLGAATATTVNKVTITAPATSATLTIANGKTLTASNTLTFTGTDSSSVAFGGGGTVAFTSNNLSAFASTTSAQLAGVLSDETGTGAFVLGTSPTITTPTIAKLANLTSNGFLKTSGGDGTLSVDTGTYVKANDSAVTWLGSHSFQKELNFLEISTPTTSPSPGYSQLYIKDDHRIWGYLNGTDSRVAQSTDKLSDFAATTSAELASILSDETGSGSAVFGTSPTVSSATLSSTVTHSGSIQNTGVISPAQITSTQNDYAPTGYATAYIMRLTSDTSRTISGIVAASGRTYQLFNIGSFNITLRHEDTGSTAANRFTLIGSNNFILRPGSGCQIFYDNTSSRWRLATPSLEAISPANTSGDLITHNGNAHARVGIGSTNQILSVVGGFPTWTDGVNPNVEVNLTHNTATTVTSYTVPTMTSAGGTLVYTVTCSDGTEVQSNSGTFKWMAYNKADTFSTDGSQTQSTKLSSGSLTVTFTFVTDGATDNVAIKCTASSSLTPTTLKIVYNNADGSVGTITIPSASVGYSNLTSANMTTLARRNRIINGDMLISQRSAGSGATPADQTYMVDRWMIEKNYEGTLTWSKDSTVPAASDFTTAGRPYQAFQNSLKLSSTQDSDKDAGEYVAAMQKIEGYNIADLIGDAYNAGFTISFWVKCSATGTYGVGIRDGTASRSYIGQYTISGTGWEYKTITVTAAPTGGTGWNKTSSVGLLVDFTFHVGTTYGSPGSTGAWTSTNSISTSTNTSFCAGSGTSTVYLTGVQLEPGTSATPFEFNNFQQCLSMCQRYYEKSNGPATYPGDGADTVRIWHGTCDSSNSVVVMIPLLVPKRNTSPTITLYRSTLTATANRLVFYNGSTWSDVSSQSGTLPTDRTLSIALTFTATFGLNYAIAGGWVVDNEL